MGGAGLFSEAVEPGMLLLNALRKATNTTPITAAWDAMERLLRDLQNRERRVEQIRCTLQAIHEGLGADLAFWYPGTSDESMEIVGDFPVSPEWCRKFADAFLLENPAVESALVQTLLNPKSTSTEGSRAPSSVAMAQVSRTKSIWIVALSFDPQRTFAQTDAKVLSLARRMLLGQRQHAKTFGKLKDALFGLISSLTAAIDAKDPYTCGHSERVARIAVRIGQQMGMTASFLSDIYLAGLLHDIGKIGIEDSILRKPAQLTPEEFVHIQEHPVTGDRIISSIKQFEHLRPGVRSHHERYDGRGYPDGLAGEDIPMLARILAVADSCDAMMSSRPYRGSLPTWQIDQILLGGAGAQWDRKVIEAFMACREELYCICQKGIGASVAVAVEQAVQRNDSRVLRGRECRLRAE
jgi:HD-GYP domain-containing protein (c-di-GMP phosphodiesterase class II)